MWYFLSISLSVSLIHNKIQYINNYLSGFMEGKVWFGCNCAEWRKGLWSRNNKCPLTKHPGCEKTFNIQIKQAKEKLICKWYILINRAGTSSDLICRVCLKGCHGGLVLSMEVLSTCIWVVAGAITVGGALSACSAAVLQNQCWPTPTYCSLTTKIWTQMSLKISF